MPYGVGVRVPPGAPWESDATGRHRGFKFRVFSVRVRGLPPFSSCTPPPRRVYESHHDDENTTHTIPARPTGRLLVSARKEPENLIGCRGLCGPVTRVRNLPIYPHQVPSHLPECRKAAIRLAWDEETAGSIPATPTNTARLLNGRAPVLHTGDGSSILSRATNIARNRTGRSARTVNPMAVGSSPTLAANERHRHHAHSRETVSR